MTEQLVTSEREYHEAVKRVFELMVDDPPSNSREGEELARLAAAVERFEAERYPMGCCAFAARDCATRLLALMRKLGELYDIEAATRWCESAQPLLDGQRPVDMLTSEKGAAEVDAVIARLIDSGHV
jgi:hypothetical protein